jgi:AcrR family transcriptional regulator
MRKPAKSLIRRRQPTQRRAQETVGAILDAVIRLLKRGGVSAVTTNSVAETAGVSIGSVYQYFPNKQAIFIALHERHIHQVDQVLRRKISESEGETLDVLVASLLDGMIEMHASDPELATLLGSEVPHRADGAMEF